MAKSIRSKIMKKWRAEKRKTIYNPLKDERQRSLNRKLLVQLHLGHTRNTLNTKTPIGRALCGEIEMNEALKLAAQINQQENLTIPQPSEPLPIGMMDTKFKPKRFNFAIWESNDRDPTEEQVEIANKMKTVYETDKQETEELEIEEQPIKKLPQKKKYQKGKAWFKK